VTRVDALIVYEMLQNLSDRYPRVMHSVLVTYHWCQIVLF